MKKGYISIPSSCLQTNDHDCKRRDLCAESVTLGKTDIDRALKLSPLQFPMFSLSHDIMKWYVSRSMNWAGDLTLKLRA